MTDPTPQTEESTTTAATTATAESTTASIAQTTTPTTATASTVVTTATVPTVSYIPTTTSTTGKYAPTGPVNTGPIYPTTGVAPQGVAQTKSMAEGIPFDIVTHIVVYELADDAPQKGADRRCVVLKAGSDAFNAVKDLLSNTEGDYMGSTEGKPWNKYYSNLITCYADTADAEMFECGEIFTPHGETYSPIAAFRVATEYGYFLSSSTYYSLDGEVCDTWRDFLGSLSYPVEASGFDYNYLDRYVSAGD